MTRTLLLVGTRKGAFILDGGRDRTGWSLSEPLCDGWPIHDLQWDDTTGSLYAGAIITAAKMEPSMNRSPCAKLISSMIP